MKLSISKLTKQSNFKKLIPKPLNETLRNRKIIKVVELFAGVGGFRLGLEKSNYKVIWSNQWEPLTKKQHASMVYEARFGKQNHSNEDIATVPTEEIPDHDLLCGGFPCQDYSVATTRYYSKGLEGRKGMLWWSIHRILKEKKKKPNYLFLENVDRLLKSPTKQRGKDFAVILQSLNELGYAVEWRVINAADYGMPQRRNRIFLLGYHQSTKLYQRLLKSNIADWLTIEGVLANAFPVFKPHSIKEIELIGDVVDFTNWHSRTEKTSPFQNTGVSMYGKVFTTKTVSNYHGDYTVLGDVLLDVEVSSEFFIDQGDKAKWEYLKSSKTLQRVSKEGYTYNYSEGRMIYPDTLDKPSRTIITGEGGKSPSRFKHVIASGKGLRRLTPVELERLNMFPDNHTQLKGITDAKRAFLMGNALVVGVVEKIAEALYKHIAKYEHV